MPSGVYLHKKGILKSATTKKKISNTLKRLGIKPPSVKGKHWTLSEGTRRKLSEVKKGEKSSNWKGGITPENHKIRNSLEMKLWREAVLARDNWICQKCSQRGGSLKTHHIFNFASYIDLRFDINNGITLCDKCHKAFHKAYGFKNNTRGQLEEFLEY